MVVVMPYDHQDAWTDAEFAALRKATTSAMGRPLSDGAWRWWVEKGFADDALAKGTDGPEWLADEIGQSSQVDRVDRVGRGLETINRRAEVLSEVYAAFANSDALDVRRFRAKWDLGVHRPSGQLPSWLDAKYREALPASWSFATHLLDSRGEPTVEAMPAAAAPEGTRVLDWTPVKGGPPGRAFVPLAASDFFPDLFFLVDAFEQRYPWDRLGTVNFVLSDEIPFAAPVTCTIRHRNAIGTIRPEIPNDIKVGALQGKPDAADDLQAILDDSATYEDHTRTRVTLEIDPATGPEELARIWRELRASRRPSNRRRNRPQGDKGLALAAIGISDPDARAGRNWRGVRRQWNRRHSDLGTYDSDGPFRTDVVRARERLLCGVLTSSD